jgi:class 3 adenylate cyclase
MEENKNIQEKLPSENINKDEQPKVPLSVNLLNKINTATANEDNAYFIKFGDINRYLQSNIDLSNINRDIFISTGINKGFLGNASFDNQLKLEGEIIDLKKKLKKTLDELQDTQADNKNKIEEFGKLKNQLISKEKISHILSRISENGRKKLLESEDFQGLFKNSNKCEAVVVAIDIRRSTELMLKARTPELFSKFITELSFKLSQIIISNFGIFDKFTGDGILAFFPKFYSGADAIIRSLKAANECHKAFKEHYNNSKDCFNVFIKDVGLGIGIDYGNVTLVNTQSELTVVGIPVVYACRFSGAKAGETLINQPAREEIMNLCPNLASFIEGEINIKNEGIALGYNVTLNETAYNLQDPNWDELIIKFKS